MKPKQIEVFKNWLFARHSKLTNKAPRTIAEKNIKLLIEKSNKNAIQKKNYKVQGRRV
jgi:hypothetical protein